MPHSACSIVLAISVSAFAAASSGIVTAESNGTQAAAPSGSTAGAQPGSSASSGDPLLTQVTNPNGSITSTWTAPDGTIIAKDTFTDNGDGTTTWSQDSFQNGNVYSSTTYTTNADGSSVSNTVYADGRSVIINADATGKITEMKETPPLTKSPAGGSQAPESAQPTAAPAPATEPPTEVTVEPVDSVGIRYSAIKITYTPPAAKVGGGSSATAPGSTAGSAQNRPKPYLEFLIKRPLDVKISDAGTVTSGTSTGGAVNPITTPTPTYSGTCVLLSGTLELCKAPPAQNPTAEAPGSTYQATIYWPTFTTTNEINGLYFDFSGLEVTGAPNGSIIGFSPLNFNISGATTAHVRVNLVQGPNGTRITLTPEPGILPQTVTPAGTAESADQSKPEDLLEIYQRLSKVAFLQPIQPPVARRRFTDIRNSIIRGSNSAVANPVAPNSSTSATGPTTTPSTPLTPSTGIHITVPVTGMYFNPTTGETATFTPGQSPPVDWSSMLTVPAPFISSSGNSTSFLPGQEPRLYVNPTAGQPQWVPPPYTPPSGFIPSIPAFSLDLSIPAAANPSTPSTTPSTTPTTPTSPQTPTVSLSTSDYGAGSSIIRQTDATGAIIGEVIEDPQKTPRRTETYSYTSFNGKQYRSEKDGLYYNSKGRLTSSLRWRYDTDGSLTFLDSTRYGQHGERTSEEITNYYTWGFESMDWSPSAKYWADTFTTYKFPTTPGSTTPTPTPYTPVLTSIGMTCPRSFYPGATIDCSLWPSSYADGFKPVPGLVVGDLSTLVARRPDGSPSWPSLEVGIPGEGYVPVRPDGKFSLHLPLDWKPSLKLNLRLADTYAGVSPTIAQVDLGNPVAAPTLSNEAFSSQAASSLKHRTERHLIHLWNDAYDLEEELDYEYYTATNPDWDYVANLEDELDDTYDGIDFATSILPSSDVIALAQGLTNEAKGFQSWLSTQPTLTSDDKADLTESSHWVSFLGREALYASFLSASQSQNPILSPYWTNPILNQNKLNVVRGPIGYDPIDTHIRIDNYTITPLAATPTEFYYMPPTGLTPGQHQLVTDNPFFPETTFPVFGMSLAMGAGQLQLHKGQSTTYFARLDISNGLSSNLFNGSPTYDTYLVGSSELDSIQQAAGSSRTGFISFSVTNQSTNIIMKNEFRLLNASNFVPSGSYEIDGGITAVKDGNFAILGLARANLAPIGGLGPLPDATAPSQGTPASSWIPAFTLGNTVPLTTNCSAPAPSTTTTNPTTVPGQTTPTTPTTSPTTTPSTGSTIPSTTTPTLTGSTLPSQCPDNADEELYNQALGNSTSVPVGDNPTTIDAAKKQLDDARTNIKQAVDKMFSANDAAQAAWLTALHNLPQSDQDDYEKASNREKFSNDNLQYYEKQYAKDPSMENFERIQIAQAEFDQDVRDFDHFTIYIIDQFSPEDAANWRAKQDEANKAENEYDKASSELRQAENALGELMRTGTVN